MIKTAIDAMSLRQKVGQLFTIGFCGGALTPEVIEIVTRLHVGGLRVDPNIRLSFSRYKKLATVARTKFEVIRKMGTIWRVPGRIAGRQCGRWAHA